jgi:hypothetical protein
MPPRKHRDDKERWAIRASVLAAADQLALSEATLAKLTSMLDEFVARANTRHEGGVQRGCIAAPELGEKRVIEYLLPGRRIVGHYVRINKSRDEDVGDVVQGPESLET